MLGNHCKQHVTPPVRSLFLFSFREVHGSFGLNSYSNFLFQLWANPVFTSVVAFFNLFVQGVVYKSTVADQSSLHLAPIVIDEIRVQGSRWGPFPPALRALSQKLVNVRPLISARAITWMTGWQLFNMLGRKAR